MSALAASLVVQQQAGLETDPPLRVSRPEPARDAVRPARRALDGDPQPADHHRRSAPRRRLPGRDGRLRRRLDRPDQRRRAAESRPRHRRAVDRPADRVSHRRGAESRSARRRRTSCGASNTRSQAGAEFAVTQPVFDAAAFAAVPAADRRHARFRSWPAIMPLESLRHAEFMANEVPGVQVPDAVVERMRRAENDGRAAAEGILIARELRRGDPAARAGTADLHRRGGDRGRAPGDGTGCAF